MSDIDIQIMMAYQTHKVPYGKQYKISRKLFIKSYIFYIYINLYILAFSALTP